MVAGRAGMAGRADMAGKAVDMVADTAHIVCRAGHMAVGRAADMVGRVDMVDRGCCCCCCFRKAGKGMEMVDSRILRLYLRTTVLRR